MVSLQEKNGDNFDLWVVRHSQSILAENLEEEFRFPVAEALGPRTRKIGSFICSPLSFGNKALGAVRVESPRKNFFDFSDLRVLSAVCDISAVVLERSIMMKKIADLAIRDGLTNLYLRDHFIKLLRQEVAAAFLLKEQASLVMMDIDDFKLINDAYGHSVGDAVLERVAGIMSRILSGGENLLCRFGGEEFMAFLKMPKPEAAKAVENLRAEIEHSSVRFRNQDVSVTVSLGLASYPEDALNVEDWVFSADMGMYKAKQGGKNQVCSL
jgi:diguanylate cyclase (GGDEF)-like protein